MLVSFDGMRHDFLDRVATPAFDRLAGRGVRAEALLPVFPTKTFPNHYAIATGNYGDAHGIVANVFYDPARGAWFRLSDRAAVEDGRWYGGEPIWTTAERQGVRAATFFWPGSEAKIGGWRPSYWERYDGTVPDSVRVDSSIAWLRLPPPARPRLVMLYFSGVDDAAHHFGPLSPEADSAVVHADRMLGRLLDSLGALPIAERVNVVVVSDHGMVRVGEGQVIALDTIAPLDSTVRSGDPGPLLSLWFGGDTARLEAAHAALSAGMRHARAYRRDEIPARWRVARTARIGDLLVVAEPGWLVTRSVPAWSARPAPGQHGYDPAEPDVHGIFLASGPGIAGAGSVPPFENIHVHPLVAHLLGIAPSPSADGRLEAVRGLLARGDRDRWETAPSGAETP
ncbi:MAG TPA: ectonucleotide pyrophosphatase/phosphodiesterase [Gemmatimonadaceae bacterium]